MQQGTENRLRYRNEDKENYRNDLERLIQMKQMARELEKQREKQEFQEMEKSYPFGQKSITSSSSDPGTPRDRAFNNAIAEYDPWGKGSGNPQRDENGNVRRQRAGRSEPDLTSDRDISLLLGGSRASSSNSRGSYARMRNQSENTDDDQYPWGNLRQAYKQRGKLSDQAFMEKMGWSNSQVASKDAKKNYLDDLKKEMDEKRQRDMQERQITNREGKELTSIMMEKVVGKPRFNETTGELENNTKSSSDVTTLKFNIRRANPKEMQDYHGYLAQQAEQRQKQKQIQKEQEIQEQLQHAEAWDAFWGKPGNGAPRDVENHRKENLTVLLNKSPGLQTYGIHALWPATT